MQSPRDPASTRALQEAENEPLAPWSFPLPWEPRLLTDNAEALGLWSPHPPASFSCQGLDQSPGRVACDLWPHKLSPQGQSQPLFTSLNFIYRANEGSPTPKAGQASLKTEAAHPLPPCQPLLNPKASVEGPLPTTVAVILPIPGRSGFLAGFRVACPLSPAALQGPGVQRKERSKCVLGSSWAIGTVLIAFTHLAGLQEFC